MWSHALSSGHRVHHEFGEAGDQAFSDGAGPGRQQYGLAFSHKVGAGAFSFDTQQGEIFRIWCAVASVEGRQTVLRAELTGALLTLAAGHHQVFSDSRYVVNGSAAINLDPEGNDSSYLKSVNCDLWHRFLG